MRTNARFFAPAQILPASILAPLASTEIFGRAAPLEVDLGCGDGSFLVALAEQNPDRDFLGVEQLVGRMRSATRKIGERELTNARVLHSEILHALQHFLPPASVDTLHLMFPDPWPKRRHHRRRTFDGRFLRAASRALKPGGVLRVATDDPAYFEAMREVLNEPGPFAEDAAEAENPLPASTFENRFRTRALPIYRLALRNVRLPR